MAWCVIHGKDNYYIDEVHFGKDVSPLAIVFLGTKSDAEQRLKAILSDKKEYWIVSHMIVGEIKKELVVVPRDSDSKKLFPIALKVYKYKDREEAQLAFHMMLFSDLCFQKRKPYAREWR